jgi:glutathione peroxidase-family protein
MTMESTNVHDFSVKNIEGRDQALSEYKGKLLLIVNVASKCGFTKQYDGLQMLYDKYKDKGLVVLGFPANDFMGQEPGTNEEIKKFCSLKFGVSFPMFSKISVKGKDIDPLYKYLTASSGFNGDISWNFNKFLVDGKGNVIARFGSNAEPLSKEVLEKIDSALSAVS